jgi:hypothetical protein
MKFKAFVVLLATTNFAIAQNQPETETEIWQWEFKETPCPFLTLTFNNICGSGTNKDTISTEHGDITVRFHTNGGCTDMNPKYPPDIIEVTEIPEGVFVGDTHGGRVEAREDGTIHEINFCVDGMVGM